jgi:hypothetical protein
MRLLFLIIATYNQRDVRHNEIRLCAQNVDTNANSIVNIMGGPKINDSFLSSLGL